MPTIEVSLGRGMFGWHSSERQGGRWGSVGLFSEEQDGSLLFDLAQIQALEGFKGILTARVISKSSLAKYDNQFSYRRAEVGELVTLVYTPGTFFIQYVDALQRRNQPFIPPWGPYVGIAPGIPRDEDWMDTKAIHNIDSAQVELFFLCDDLHPDIYRCVRDNDLWRARVIAKRLGVVP